MNFTESKVYNKNLRIKRFYTIIVALSLILVIFNFATITEAANNDKTVRINEIMYDPPGYDYIEGEWIEIYNYGTDTVDISNLVLYLPSKYRSVNNIQGGDELPPGEYAIIANDYLKFLQEHPEFNGILMESNFYLPNSCTEIKLTDEDLIYKDVIDETYYEPIDEANDTGKTLELNMTGIWKASPTLGGTPGRENNILKPLILEKKVWNGSDWKEFITTYTEENIRFKIKIMYNDDPYNGNYIYNINITDFLPEGLIYDNNATTQETYISTDKRTIKWKLGEDFCLCDSSYCSGCSGNSFTLEFNATVISGRETVINTVNVSAFETCPHKWRYAEDTAEINIKKSEITIEKNVNRSLIHKGDSVKYKYYVNNTGNCNLTNIVLTDDKISSTNINFISGDSNSDGYLNTTESWLYESIVNINSDTTNIGTVTAEDTNGNTVTAEDDCFVDVIDTNLTVTKTANITKGHIGDKVNYTITVENTGLDPLYNVYTNDTTLGKEYHLSTLNGFQTKTYYVEHILQATPDPFINTVKVEGYDELGKRYNDTDKATVDIINGSINVTKTANISQGYIGDLVNYTITVKNTGEDTLYNVYTNDTKLGITKHLNRLNPTETKTYYEEYTLQITPDPYINTVETEGYDILGKKYTDTDTATVDVIQANIKVVKTATPTIIHKNEPVTWNITVENIGIDTLTNVNVTDDTGVLIDGLTLIKDQIWYYEYTTNPIADTTNHVLVNGTDPLGNYVTNTSSASVNVINSSISINKTVNPTKINKGQTVEYTYEIKNTGECNLTSVLVTDDQYLTPQYKSGDTNSNNWLDTTETWIYNVTTTINSDTTNIGNVTAIDILGSTVTDEDDCFVDVIDSNLTVEKTANITKGHIGDKVNYTITVENTGIDQLKNVYVNDTTLGIEYYLSTLDSGQTKTYYKNHILTQSLDPFINKVEAEGYDILGKRYNDTAKATVDIIIGNISVTKTANISAGRIGDKVNYTITVKNTGEDILYNVYVNDTKLGMTKHLNRLNPTETETYYAEYTLQITPDPYINTVETEGYDILGKKYTDTDTETVDVINSTIEITKTVNKSIIYPGDIVLWNITVENTGSSILSNVNITDTNKGDIATGEILTPGEKYYHEYTTNPNKNITNTAIVNATDPLGQRITDSDTAKVTVINPDIKITKTANITTGYIGDKVNYTIKVENIGTDPLYNVYTNDTQLNFNRYVDKLNPGKNITYNIIHTLQASPDPFINTAETEGYDELGKRYNDTDTATVNIKCKPEITVDKKAWDGTKWVDRVRIGQNIHTKDIRFNITITNIGTCDLVDINVKDILGCTLIDAREFTIQPIEPISITRKTYTWFFEKLNTSENIFIEFNATEKWWFEDDSNTVIVKANSSTTTETITKQDVVEITDDNTAPIPEKPEGKTSGFEDIEYEFNFTATDPEGDNVYYMIDWGDSVSSWYGPYASGEKITKTHSWSTKDTYDIKLNATDSLGAISLVWSQPLTIEILDDNNPPTPEKPEGKTEGVEDTDYEFNFTAVDPEGDNVYYKIDWGNTVTDWLGPYISGEKITKTHSWSAKGDYEIKLQAKDAYDLESSWSQPLTIEITHVNSKPNKPDNPSPGNKGTEIDTDPVLSVEVSDPDGDTITVKFYNGKNDNLIGTDTVTGGSGKAEVTWTGLSNNNEYEWYAEAEDSEGEISLSDVWSFTTAPPPGDDDDDTTDDDDDTGDDDDDTTDDDDDEPEVFNNPPEIINFTGNLTGDRNQTLNYSALGIDLDNHDIKYEFDWDDGNINTTEYVENNTIYNITHNWTKAGIYEISVRAFDDYQDENGTWSAKEYLEILIDAHIIDDKENDVDGYLTDDKGNDSYDNFHNKDGAETAVEKDGDYYLIDTDGDGTKDYKYNPLTEKGSKIKDEEDDEKEGKTETLDENVIYYIAGIIIVIVLLLILFFITRKKEKDK